MGSKTAPTYPTGCPVCGGRMYPLAYLDIDSWVLSGWDCENYCGGDMSDTPHPWPFDPDQVVTSKELKEIGYLVVEG